MATSDKLSLNINFTFSGNLTDAQKHQVLQNVANALRADVDGEGLVPDDCEEFTESFTVVSDELKAKVQVDILIIP